MAITRASLKSIEEYIFPNTAYTLVSQITLQKIFNATANGAVSVSASTSYFFECSFSLSAMSSLAGNFGFGFLGTATFTSVSYTALSNKSATLSIPSMTEIVGSSIITATPLVSSSVVTTGLTKISGIIRINAEGTLIPSVSLSIASPAVVGLNSYFRLVKIATNTQTNIGQWL